MSLLDVSDAFAMWSHVPSHLMFEGADRREPRLSICIPTFRRPDLLVEAVASAIGQDWGEPFEVIVVDNDPESTFADILRQKLPAVERGNFRYYVNAENTGMFGNWNRSIELARAPWYTMLHDDDLLEPDFASKMMPILENDGRVEGLACRRRFFVGSELSAPPPSPKTLALRLVRDMPYRGKRIRLFGAHHFFWWAENPVGLICRKTDLIALGGYQPDEYPTSDHYFQLRVRDKAQAIRMPRLSRQGKVRRERNRPDPRSVCAWSSASTGCATGMAGTVVPRWWMRASGLIMARRSPYCTPAMIRLIEEGTAVTLPKNRPLLLAALRMMSGGY